MNIIHALNIAAGRLPVYMHASFIHNSYRIHSECLGGEECARCDFAGSDWGI